MTEPVLDVEAVEEEPQGLIPLPPANLFHTDDPVEVLARAKRTADALAPVIRAAGLVHNVSGKDYLTVEAWQTLGAQVGVTPVITSSARVSDPDGWEARCEARTLDGRTIGAADGMCLRAESRWKSADDFAVRSMAQTRAMSRALASVLRFIPTLAGFAGTPAEEMTGVKVSEGGDVPSVKQLDFIVSLARDLGADASDQELLRAYSARRLTGGKEGSGSKAIAALKGDTEMDPADALVRFVQKATEWAAKDTDLPADSEGLPVD